VCPVFLPRPFNHAGPRQSAGYVTSAFAQQIAEIEAGLREPVLRVGNLEARRDITDVRDTVRAYAMLFESGRPRRPYNICTGTPRRVGDLLQMLLGFCRTSIRTSVDEARLRPVDNPIVVGDPSRIAAEVGWQARIPIERTLEDLLDYWRLRVAAPHA
jgi:GDP-4-dehydro-6-deoxy-D-mannose reductase